MFGEGSDMQELVGLLIESIWVGEGEGQMTFVTNQGNRVYTTWGDCCSETWFSDIYGLDALLGHTVVTVQTAALPNYDSNDGRGRQLSDGVYGYDLLTEAGTASIVFRNSSNGYYGGSVEYAGEHESTEGMRQLTGQEWSA